jgi:hypothetical protein
MMVMTVLETYAGNGVGSLGPNVTVSKSATPWLNTS